MNNIDKFFDKNIIKYGENYINYLTKVVKGINLLEVKNFVDVLMRAREKKASIFFIGNGGSAATASHFANDIGIGSCAYKNPFRAFSLVDNHSVITAIANDFGYDEIFVRQLKVLGKSGDVLVAISASGNSPNLIKALDYASQAGMITVGLTSFDGGLVRQRVSVSVHIPAEKGEYGPAEDSHMIIDHLVGSYLSHYVLHE